MIDILVTQRCHPGFEERFEALLRKVEGNTVANDEGCLRYEWYRAPEPQTYVLVERWTSMEAAKTHLNSEHFQAILPEMQACVPERFSIRQLARVSESVAPTPPTR